MEAESRSRHEPLGCQAFGSCSVVSRDRAGRIEIGGADDSEKDQAWGAEAADDLSHPIEDRILEQVAESDEGWSLDVEEIARAIDQKHIVTRHYVDQLIRRGFLREQRSVHSGSTYRATGAARAYLVERGLV